MAGKRALVTGAGMRLGRAIAVALGASGAHVAVHYHRSRGSADETCELITRAGGQAVALQADLNQPGAAEWLVSATLDRLGGLNLLVPSAANFERVPYAEVDEAAWDRALRLNLSAPFLLVKHATAALRRSHGAVVFVTCSSTRIPFLNYLPYVVSKGALGQLMRTLALELAPEVRVNAVAPGTVLPPATMSADTIDSLARRTPLQRTGAADDVAKAVVYLATAEFVTGQELYVDGGRSVAPLEPRS